MLALATGACGAGGVPPEPLPEPTTNSPQPSPVVPADGVPLVAFGYQNGPVRAFYLPRATRLSVAVDQPNNVTVVFAQPTPAEVYAFYRRTLEPAGFQITAADDAATTLTFTGYGWTGSLTADEATVAVLLRPS